MKKNFILICIILFISICYAQADNIGITFTFANGEITAGGTNGYYEFDVMANASATGTKIGTGMLYLNYSILGFGQSIYGNSKVTVTKGTLTSNAGPPLYLLLINDNTSSRLAVTFEYTSSAGWGNSLPTTPTNLIHVKIEIADPSETSGLSFENSLMTGCQFYDDNATKYDPVIAIDTDNNSLPGILSTPANVSINIDGNNVIITWDVVPNATLYKVYSSENPYSGFNSPDPTGIFIDTTWTAPVTNEKKFYYVTAE